MDAQTCKVIVLDKTIQSMTEFKQIIGRGTRVREDHGKRWFTILDYRRATQHFADPEFDGEPIQIKDREVDPPEPGESNEPGEARAKYYVEDVTVSVVQERVQYFDAEGRLITESLRDYTRGKVLDDYASLDVFLQRWTKADRKTAVLAALAEHGVLLEALEEEVGQQYDPFDLICHVVYDQPLRTRTERPEVVRSSDYFSKYGEAARAVLDALLDKYADVGPTGLEDAQLLRLRPLSELGTPVELINTFGGRAGYEAAIRELESQLYATA